MDSPVFRWTIGALARGAKERETLRPWREALRSARRWIFSARCCLVRDTRKPVPNTVQRETLETQCEMLMLRIECETLENQC
jgi:hypothetical protein